jgi:hypothetical protein
MMCRVPPLRTFLPTILLALSVSPAVASITRVEQDDKSISYSGNWYGNESPNLSGGTAALTNTRGARVSITFTGSGIAWIGVSDGWSGFATLYLDGVMKVIDTYGNNAYQREIFKATGLGSGPHVLSIEVMHERGPGTDGSWVWIDAFEIENGAPIQGGLTVSAGRVEENNPALVYSGRWYGNDNPAHSGGHASLATDAGARVSIPFNGTGISWLAYRDEWSGVARVYLDGQEKTTIDNYLSPSQARVAYSVNGLPSGGHTLTIEVTGIHDQSSKGSWIWLDAFDVVQ